MYVAKVEKLATVSEIGKSQEKKSQDETYSPWADLREVGEERSNFDDLSGAKGRRELHLKVKGTLESVGIATTEYLGGVVASAKDVGTPMYIEVWDYPGKGEMMGVDEEQLDELYDSEEGQEKLFQLAKSLMTLSKKGFVYDVFKAQGRTATVLKTTKSQLPYPRNFYLTEDDEFVAIDFNFGIDLADLELI